MAKNLKAFIVIILASVLLVGCGGAGASSNTTVNGTTIEWTSKSKTAVNRADMELVGSENQMIIDLTESEAQNVELTLTGKNGGKSYTASTDDIISDGINWVKSFTGDVAVVHGEGNSFLINSNVFEDGEVVVVEASFITSSSKLDQAFGKGAESQYWAFIAKHSEDAPAETETGDEETADGTSTGDNATDADTDADANAETGVGTSADQQSEDGIIDNIGEFINGLTADTSIDGDGVSDVSEEPKGKLLYDGKELTTYSSQGDAEYADEVQQQQVTLNGTTVEIQGVPVVNVHAITIKVENSSGGETAAGVELNAGNEWKSTLDFSEFAGQRVLLKIMYKGSGMLPSMSTAYIIIHVPTPTPAAG